MKERDYKIDILRILSCYAVIVLHTACEYIYRVSYNGMQIRGLNFYHAITRFAVPSFVMITGAMSLGKECIMNQKWKQKIIKFVFLYVVYALIYSVVSQLKVRNFSSNTVEKNLFCIIQRAIKDPKYHLWYIPMYIGLCLSIPLLVRLRKSIDSKKLFQYLISLFILFQLLPNTFDAFENEKMDVVADIIGRVKGDTFLKWSAFLVIGYYVYTYNVKRRKLLYVAGGSSIILAMVLSNIATIQKKKVITNFYDDLTLFSAVWAAAVFTFFRNREWNFKMNDKLKHKIVDISGKTLGIYLIHILVLNILNQFGINAVMGTSWIFTPLVAGIVFLISLFIVSGIKKIPVLNHWIV